MSPSHIAGFGLSVALIALAMTGCEPPTSVEVTVTPGSAALEVGGTQQFMASSTDAADTFAWTSDDESVATVDGTGLVTAVALGDAMVTATGSESGATDMAAVMVVEMTAEEDGPPAAPLITTSIASTSELSVTLDGTARANSTIEVQGGVSIAMTSADGTGAFSVEVSLGANRLNRLFVTAIGSDDERSAPTGFTIVQDGKAPSLFIDFPEDGEEVTNESISIAGRVADLLSGFMGLEVEVNGVAADVDEGIGTNGTFERRQVPLEMGPNIITATAMDVVGNEVMTSITVNRVALEGPRLNVVSGGDQSGTMRGTLQDPLVVQMTQEDGTPIVNKTVSFDIIRSDGRMRPAFDDEGPGMRKFQVRTDGNGLAQVFWQLGTDAGCGNNRIKVTSKDISGSTFFCATALAAPPVQVNVGSGNGQRSEAGAPAPEMFNAWVSDGNNPVRDVPVTFRVATGDGSLSLNADVREVTVMTDRTGHAKVPFKLGDTPGQNVVQAVFAGGESLPASFSARGVGRTPNAPTMFSGFVQDNSNQPIGGVEVEIEVNGQTLPVETTDAEGIFSFSGIPGGVAHVHFEGSTATSLNGEPIDPGTFPALAFETTIVPNAENRLPRPVLLPELNPVNSVVYDGSQDVVLTIEGMEGLELTVRAGSMMREDGSLPSPSDPATLSLNQVHKDDIPMPMPDGVAPPFAWTFQPAGATFDPPVEVVYPNMSGLAPGAVAYFLSFDHDTNRFEIVSSATVSEDGSQITSDPGSGIPLSGWAGNCPPYAVTGIVRNCFDVAVAILSGSPRCPFAFPGVCPDDWSSEVFSEALRSLATEVRDIDDGRVTARIFPAANSAEAQLSAVEDWIDSLTQPPIETPPNAPISETCPRPRVVLVGHSLGGDSVRLSDGDIPVEAEVRIVAEPISRELVLDDFPGVPFYQRDREFPVPADADPDEDTFVTFLAEDDLTAAERTDCSDVGFDNFADIPCLRGYEVTDATETIIVPGTDHASIIESDAFRERVIAEVDALVTGGKQNDDRIIPEGFTLFANGRATEIDADGSYVIQNITAPDMIGRGGTGPLANTDFIADDPISVVGVGEIDGEVRYLISSPFRITQGAVTIVDDFTPSDTPPPFPKEILLDFEEAVLSPGEMMLVTTTAVSFSDELSDVSTVDDGTTYRVSNSSLFTVDDDGNFDALQFGVGFVTASNMGAVASKRVTITGDTITTTIEGFVLDEDGNPLEGATVMTTAFGGEVTTDADGFFSVEVELPSFTQFVTLTVESSAGDFDSDLLPVVADGITDAGLLAPRPLIVMTTVVGSVELEDGTPVENAAVFTNRGGQALTNAAGDFFFDVSVEAPGGTIPTLDVTARGVVGDDTLLGQAAGVPIVVDGTTDAGVITIRSSAEVLYPGARYDLAYSPTAFGIGDVNGDGLMDVLSSTSESNSMIGQVSALEVLISNGDGTFQSALFHDTPYSAQTIEVGDFDGDGNIDAALSFDFVDDNNGIAIHLGNGDGTFQSPPILVEDAVGPRSIAAGDVDNDGVLDLLIGDIGFTPDILQFVVQLGVGDGTFGTGMATEVTGLRNSVFVDLGDMNNDGNLDLVLTHRGDTNIEVRLGNGDGTFGEPEAQSLRFGPFATVVRDFDGDGNLDVASINQSIDVSVLLGNGDGTLQEQVLYPTGADPRALATGDFDNDGVLDLVVPNTTGNNSNIGVLFGVGDGTFSEPLILPVSRFGTAAAAVTDTDQDGNDDILVGIMSEAQVLVLRGNGDRTFETQIAVPTDEISNRELLVADIDGDSNLDLMTVFPIGTIGVLPGNGDLTFGEAITTPTLNLTGIAQGRPRILDVDGDGNVDVLVLIRNPVQLGVHLGVGDGTFEDMVTIASDAATHIDAEVGDLDRDGARDLVMSPGPNNGINVHLGLGGINFQDPFELGSSGTVQDLGLIDLDGDNALDIFATGSAGILVLFGNGDGSFAPVVSFPGGGAMVEAGDVNGDGTPDLLATSFSSSIVTLVENNGDRTFEQAVGFNLMSVDFGLDLLTVADVNTDGAADIVLSVFSTGLGVLLGDGSGFFSGLTIYDLGGTFTGGIQVIDMNGDSLPDVVTANGGSSDFSILLHR